MGVINNLQVNGANPAIVGGIGTTIKVFPNPLGPSIGAVPTTASPLYGVGALAVPGSNRLNGQLFRVAAAGDFTIGAGGVCPLTTISLLCATSLANLKAGTYTTLVSAQSTSGNEGGAQSLAYAWMLDCEFMGTTASNLVQGRTYIQVDQTNTSTANITPVTGVNFANENALFFAIGVTFSVSEAGNTANLYQFILSDAQ